MSQDRKVPKHGECYLYRLHGYFGNYLAKTRPSTFPWDQQVPNPSPWFSANTGVFASEDVYSFFNYLFIFSFKVDIQY